MMAVRFNVEIGDVVNDGAVIHRMGNRPLIPDEIWNDDRIEFRESDGGEIDQQAIDDLPEDLRKLLNDHWSIDW